MQLLLRLPSSYPDQHNKVCHSNLFDFFPTTLPPLDLVLPHSSYLVQLRPKPFFLLYSYAEGKTRVMILKALTRTSFSHSRWYITLAYKHYLRVIIAFAHSYRQQDTSDSNWQNLQTTQNITLDNASKCTNSQPCRSAPLQNIGALTKVANAKEGSHTYQSTDHLS